MDVATQEKIFLLATLLLAGLALLVMAGWALWAIAQWMLNAYSR